MDHHIKSCDYHGPTVSTLKVPVNTFDLELGVKVVGTRRGKKGEKDEVIEDADMKRVDICAECTARGLGILLKGLSHEMTRAFYQVLMAKPQAPPSPSPGEAAKVSRGVTRPRA